MIAHATGEGIVDCHVHVFDPMRFPYQDHAPRPADNETATVEHLIAVLDAHGISRAVVVSPTAGYRGNSQATIHAAATSPSRLAAIASIDPLTDKNDSGMLSRTLGVRVDLLSGVGSSTLRLFEPLIQRIEAANRVLDVQCAGGLTDEDATRIADLRCRVVIDHMGRPDPALGIDQHGFRNLLALAAHKHVFVKLSGPFRFSRDSFPFPDADRFARRIVEVFGPAQCVWGSDWPFVRMNQRLDYGPSLIALRRWVDDDTSCTTILTRTPRQLFCLDADAGG